MTSTVLLPPEQLELPLASSVDPPELFRRVFRRLGVRHPAPSFCVEFRPFAGLRSSIRLRNNHAEVHISDVLEDAPLLVLEALAEILLAQVYRRRPSREARECYLAHVFKPFVRQRIDDARRQRGRKRLLPARGRYYDLNEIFSKLNRRFFQGRLPRPRLGWSPGRSRTILGHYDSAHGVIGISRIMDALSVPSILVEYLVYHEMLHIRFPVERHGHRRVLHSREFHMAEKKFPHYELARRRLKQFCV